MPDQLLSMLIQLPIVAVFVWYSDRMQRQFQEFLREERLAREKQNERVAAELDRLTSTFNDHRNDFSAAIAKMEGRNSSESKRPPRV